MIWQMWAIAASIIAAGGFCLLIRLERKNLKFRKSLDMFHAEFGHEIKTPLNGIIGFSELLQDDGLPVEERKQYIRNLNLSAQTLLKLVSDLLDCAKYNLGKTQLHPVRTDLRQLCGELPVILEALLQERDLRLAVELPDDLPPLYIDAIKIHQILINLVGNAIKFSAGGTIRIRGEFHRTNSIYGMLVLQVIDTGRGISNEYQKSIFDPFVQENRGDFGAGNGVGLGLAITMKIIKLMKGKIRLKSETGKGSCFTITLPKINYDSFQ